MKIWTQKDVDAVAPDEDGIRHYPANSSFAEGCSFAWGCNFAGWCSFAKGCRFAERRTKT